MDVKTYLNPEGNLIIEWSEHGGPPVKPPTRRGFGSTVIESSIRHDLQGDVEIDYALAGVRARFSIPPMHFRASAGRQRRRRPPRRSGWIAPTWIH